MPFFVAAELFSCKVGDSLAYSCLVHLGEVVGRRELYGYVDWGSMFW